MQPMESNGKRKNILTKRLLMNRKTKNIAECVLVNQLSKRKGIIAKDEVILGFVNVMRRKICKERKKEKNIAYSSLIHIS